MNSTDPRFKITERPPIRVPKAAKNRCRRRLNNDDAARPRSPRPWPLPRRPQKRCERGKATMPRSTAPARSSSRSSRRPRAGPPRGKRGRPRAFRERLRPSLRHWQKLWRLLLLRLLRGSRCPCPSSRTSPGRTRASGTEGRAWVLCCFRRPREPPEEEEKKGSPERRRQVGAGGEGDPSPRCCRSSSRGARPRSRPGRGCSLASPRRSKGSCCCRRRVEKKMVVETPRRTATAATAATAATPKLSARTSGPSATSPAPPRRCSNTHERACC